MSEKVRRSFYAHFGKHNVIINLIKVEYRAEYNHIDAIKVIIKESDLTDKLKFLIDVGAQTDMLKLLITNCYNKELFKFKDLRLNRYDFRIKEFNGLNIEKSDTFFDDIIDTVLFDRFYQTASNLTKLGER